MAITHIWKSDLARVAVFEANRGLQMVRETCPNTQIWLLLSGEWLEAGDGQKRRVNPFEVYRYAPRQPCRRVVEADTRAVSIELMREGGAPVLSVDQTRAVWRIARLAMDRHVDPLALDEAIGTLGEAGEFRDDRAAWLKRAIEIVRAEFREGVVLADLAQRVGISPNHLSAAFKSAYGVPISKYVRRLRLEYALSRMGADSAAWAEAGFYDESHFWHACRVDLGLTPGQIRKLKS